MKHGESVCKMCGSTYQLRNRKLCPNLCLQCVCFHAEQQEEPQVQEQDEKQGWLDRSAKE